MAEIGDAWLKTVLDLMWEPIADDLKAKVRVTCRKQGPEFVEQDLDGIDVGRVSKVADDAYRVPTLRVTWDFFFEVRQDWWMKNLGTGDALGKVGVFSFWHHNSCISVSGKVELTLECCSSLIEGALILMQLSFAKLSETVEVVWKKYYFRTRIMLPNLFVKATTTVDSGENNDVEDSFVIGQKRFKGWKLDSYGAENIMLLKGSAIRALALWFFGWAKDDLVAKLSQRF